MKDYYEVLGVSRDASTDEIKKSFRALARETHPDANPDDPAAEERFREIAEAYEVLSDPDRRARYDRGEVFGSQDLFSQFGGLDDILSQFFGATFGGFGGRRGGPQRGPDVSIRLDLEFEDAAFGIECEVEFNAPAQCEHCSGSGSEPGYSATTCPTCGGRGRVQVARNTFLGQMMSIADCVTCHGRGQIIEHSCSVCHGDGLMDATRILTVEVPKGVENGTRLRLVGRGGAGELGGPPGDVYVQLRVVDDPRFERVGDDLHHRIAIGIAEATFGTSAAIPLLGGETQDLEIPAGTQPETVFRLGKEGVPRLQRRGRGDLLVHVAVAIPSDLSDEQEDTLRIYAEMRGEQPQPKKKGLFRR